MGCRAIKGPCQLHGRGGCWVRWVHESMAKSGSTFGLKIHDLSLAVLKSSSARLICPICPMAAMTTAGRRLGPGAVTYLTARAGLAPLYKQPGSGAPPAFVRQIDPTRRSLGPGC